MSEPSLIDIAGRLAIIAANDADAKAELDRLRTALEQILEWGNNGYAARDIARAALSPPPPSPQETDECF